MEKKEIFALALLFILVMISGFFSASETGMMASNRYRLKHLAKENKKAKRALKLLKRPDTLLGVILIGNTFANILASSIATVFTINIFGNNETTIFISTIILTLIILIFSESTPKTFAALYPEKVALGFSGILSFLQKIMYPFVALLAATGNFVLLILGLKSRKVSQEKALSHDELVTLVEETDIIMRPAHKEMLVQLLDLKKMTVEDIMIHRADIVGIDLAESWEEIKDQLSYSQHTKLPIYKEDINDVIGVIHIKRIMRNLLRGKLNKDNITEYMQPCFFVPENSSLFELLTNFQKNKERLGLVVDEYGDLKGLVTLEDILEEIVGQFTTTTEHAYKNIIFIENDEYLIDGSTTIRELNRELKLNFPEDGPKTLSGLIIEYLETIPQSKTSLKLNGYAIEIVKVEENIIKTLKLTIHQQDEMK